MIVDLNCPIELRSYELVYDDIGTPIATVTLFNLADETITSYSAVFHCEYTQGNSESENISINVDNISIDGGVFFQFQLPVSILNADKLELYFSSVNFADGSVWTSADECELVDISELRTLHGEELDSLRSIAGEDAKVYPETQDKFWRCVCGRINTLDDDECYRCRRSREHVLIELNKKITHLSRKAAIERKKRLKRAKKANERMLYQSSNTAYIILLIGSIILFFMLVFFFSMSIPRSILLP